MKCCAYVFVFLCVRNVRFTMITSAHCQVYLIFISLLLWKHRKQTSYDKVDTDQTKQINWWKEKRECRKKNTIFFLQYIDILHIHLWMKLPGNKMPRHTWRNLKGVHAYKTKYDNKYILIIWNFVNFIFACRTTYWQMETDQHVVFHFEKMDK